MRDDHGRACVAGVDFGTDSVRVLVVDARDGSELGTAVCKYPRWNRGLYCDPSKNLFRQHPLDYIESLESAMHDALADAAARTGSGSSRCIRGICIDTTGSTPCFTDADGTPLSLDPAFADDPDAMFILWKDHTAVDQAARINRHARTWGGIDYTMYEGGIYSSEWFWAKALRVIETNPAVTGAARAILEHCDWMPALLTGTAGLDEIRRSRCAAGHKAMWHESWGGYPSREFLSALSPELARLSPPSGTATYGSDTVFGRLCPEWADRLGLDESVVVTVGGFDAHIGAVGGDIGPGTLLKIMGTSTCDILVGPRPAAANASGGSGSEPGERLVAGICGQVDGSVIPGYIGYEAGQSAFGDIFAWFRNMLAWPFAALPSARALPADIAEGILPALERAATAMEPGASGVVALDWLNGRRTPDADQSLTGAIVGLSLGTDAPAVYRALVEAAAFGSRAIVERMRSEGLVVDRVSAVGGVARKSAFIMQTTADVLGMDIAVTASDQSCALGGAMFAATAAGIHPSVLAAQKAMSAGAETVYRPDLRRAKLYDELYKRYKSLGSYMEKESACRN